MVQGGWKLFNLTHLFTCDLLRLRLLRKGDVALSQMSDLDPYPLVETIVIFTVVIRIHASNLE